MLKQLLEGGPQQSSLKDAARNLRIWNERWDILALVEHAEPGSVNNPYKDIEKLYKERA